MQLLYVPPVLETWKLQCTTQFHRAALATLRKRLDPDVHKDADDHAFAVRVEFEHLICDYFVNSINRLSVSQRALFEEHTAVFDDYDDDANYKLFVNLEEEDNHSIDLIFEMPFQNGDRFTNEDDAIVVRATSNLSDQTLRASSLVRHMLLKLLPILEQKLHNTFVRIHEIASLAALPYLGPQYRDESVREHTKKQRTMSSAEEQRGMLVADIFAKHQFAAIKPRLDAVVDALGQERQTSYNAQKAMRTLLAGIIHSV